MPRLKKGDQVAVLAGKDRGKQGKVLQVFPERGRALVERINLMKRHQRQTRPEQPGGIVEREASIHISNLQVVCPKCSRGARVGFRVQPDGTKVRVCRRCQEVLA